MRFAADALERRLSGDRDALQRLASSSNVRLMAAASVLKRAGAEWPAAQLAALEIETIVQLGGEAATGDPHPDLKKVVDSLRRVAGEAAPRNRFERRKAISGRMGLKRRLARIAELSRMHAARAPASMKSAAPLGAGAPPTSESKQAGIRAAGANKQRMNTGSPLGPSTEAQS